MHITAHCVPLSGWEPPSRQWSPPTEVEDQPPLPLDEPSPLHSHSATLQHRPEHPSPRLAEICARFARLVAESLQGTRRPAGLVEHFEPGALATLTTRCSQPLRQAKVASLRVQAVREDSAEVTLRVSTNERDVAIAMRVGVDKGRWKCLALLIG
jgi:hypothetical protein